MREDVERQPLLAAGGDSQTGAGAQQNSFGFKDEDVEGRVHSAGPDELPPPYPSIANGVPMVSCKVCQTMIDITGKKDQHVVKCGQCNEATPIRNAPPGMCRVTCAHCHDTFLFNTLNNALARCPHCRKVSSVGPEFARTRSIIFMILGLIVLCIGIGITCGTYHIAEHKGGMFVLYVGAFLAALLLLLRSLYYCFMKTSLIEGPI